MNAPAGQEPISEPLPAKRSSLETRPEEPASQPPSLLYAINAVFHQGVDLLVICVFLVACISIPELLPFTGKVGGYSSGSGNWMAGWPIFWMAVARVCHILGGYIGVSGFCVGLLASLGVFPLWIYLGPQVMAGPLDNLSKGRLYRLTYLIGLVTISCSWLLHFIGAIALLFA